MADVEDAELASHFTDADFAAHKRLIEKREAAEREERARNRRAGHPRDLAEYIGEGDECVSPPILERKATGSVPFTVNRGAGIPHKEEI